MGYPTAYRTSAARAERQLSRPPQPDGPKAGNDNKPPPFPVQKPGNDNFRNQLPPRPDPFRLSPATWRAIDTIARVNPYYRAGRLGYELGKILFDLARVNTRVGEKLQLQCSVAPLCENNQACGNSYCFGPVFFNAINAALCGLAGQAIGGGRGVAPTGEVDGILIMQTRPGFPGCQPGRVVRQYQPTSALGNQRMRHMPQFVPWFTPVPRLIPRWLNPPKYMPPGEDDQATPEAPPYSIAAQRPRHWPATAGNDDPSASELIAPRLHYRSKPKGPVREAKFRGVPKLAQTLFFDVARAHGKLTDFRDLLGAFHDSLPKELQLKGKDKKSINKLLRQVWQNLDKMDGEKALAGVIKELAEDVVGGVGDMFKTEAAKKLGWTKQKFHLTPRF